MGVFLGLLASVLVTAEAPPRPEAPPIAYQVKLLEMNGLDWREALYARLRPVKRQGNATVWSADRDVVPALVGRAARVLKGPRAVAQEGHAALAFFEDQTRKVAT